MTNAENPSPPVSGMNHLAGSAVLVTGCGLASQAVHFIARIFIAAIFGAKADMDAFLAANTLPQYAIAVMKRVSPLNTTPCPSKQMPPGV